MRIFKNLWKLGQCSECCFFVSRIPIINEKIWWLIWGKDTCKSWQKLFCHLYQAYYFPDHLYFQKSIHIISKKNSYFHLMMYHFCFIRLMKQFWKIVNYFRKCKFFFLLLFQRAECHFKVSYTEDLTTWYTIWSFWDVECGSDSRRSSLIHYWIVWYTKYSTSIKRSKWAS